MNILITGAASGFGALMVAEVTEGLFTNLGMADMLTLKMRELVPA
ncbi:MAG: hypothetical protein AAF865_00505 [Pseudomonadota bacterium]